MENDGQQNLLVKRWALKRKMWLGGITVMMDAVENMDRTWRFDFGEVMCVGWSEESCIALVNANSNMSRVCHLSHNDMPSSSWCESNVSWCQHHKAMAVCGVTMVRPDNHYFIKRPRNIYSGKRHTLNNPTNSLGSCRRRLQLFEVTAVNLIKVSVLEFSFFTRAQLGL
ncbi:uncharacterized protein LOC112560533 [Pomacea canaliculata]|uniref:uncharacterized protein LOC112560533 n=1 Tax=Pomacea canaliculata TaxID=400727 RepID=UPI000D73EA35|nr:uncharacterized protein LOC112560533 [Pomacea canaliculata]